MSIGNSGRLVIEIEPELKKELHAVLRKEGTNLKTWFLKNVDQLLSEKGQESLPLVTAGPNPQLFAAEYSAAI